MDVRLQSFLPGMSPAAMVLATVINHPMPELAAGANQYDYIRAVRPGRLEGYWPRSARGRFD